MTRRYLLQALGGVAAALRILGSAQTTPDAVPSLPGPSSKVRAVAGVPLIDSRVAQSATRLARSVYPPYLFNHAMRTYIFGSLVGVAHGHRFDEETLYLACVLHDLGLTSRFEGDLPFEIQGAEAARRFLNSEGVPQHTLDLVWDGIALHPSAVSDFKAPEVALVSAGAGADVLGDSEIRQERVAETLQAFPRLGFKSAFLKTCAEVVARHPKGAVRSFMRDIGERLVPDFHPRNFCDSVEHAPFPE